MHSRLQVFFLFETFYISKINLICFQIDVWAAGVILYILLCGFPPFVSVENEQEELFERILSGQYEFTSPYWDTVSDSAKQLISNMLQAQPELRFSAEDVLDHPWLAVTVTSIQYYFFVSYELENSILPRCLYPRMA